MQIEFSRYQLLPAGNSTAQPREGALLRVQQSDGQYGYCDCHPWHELGDAPLQQQLDLLAAGKLTALTTQSLAFSKIDAEARKQNRNLFNGLTTPRNHYHVSTGSQLTDELMEQLATSGMHLIKVKMGNNFRDDIATLQRTAAKLRSCNLKLRPDFNCKLNHQQFEDFLSKCADQLDIIDFFEDPFTYDPDAWQSIREKYHVQLACDRDSLKAIAFPYSCDSLVVKPAIQDVTPFLSEDAKNRRLVLTGYLDHPIGNLSALYIAAIIINKHPELLSECGFLGHYSYKDNPFTRKYDMRGSQLIPSTEGTGFGYDNLLKELKWTLLK